MKITAVVVTYNRLELLKECVRGLKNQSIPLGEIIIVNNSSTDGTDVWLNGQTDLTVVTQENSGGAGGQFTGIRKAMENGADWIWCMDDDAEPYTDALERIVPYTDTATAALACTVIDKTGEVQWVHRGFFHYKTLMKNFGLHSLPREEYSKDLVPTGYATFVGVMINRKAIEKVGLPKKEFFLHFDDIEYSLRLNQYGPIFLVPASKILHKENASNHFFVKRVWGKDRVRIKYDKLWMRYYGIRNLTWGAKAYYGEKSDLKWILRMFYIRSIAGILLFDDHKKQRIRFFTCSYRDGLNSRFENGYDYIVKRTGIY